MASRYAILGLGLMGSRVATRLAALGHEVSGWNRSRSADLAGRCPGVRIADSPGQAAEGADAVLLLLHDGAVVREVVGGADLAAGLRDGALVLDMGTNDPGTAREVARMLGGRVRFADAPVSGGTVAAEEGTLSIFLGAPPDLAPTMGGFLAPLGRVTAFGATGQGQAAKLANQIAVACTIAGLAETLAFGEHLGLAPDRLLAAMAGGLADSRVMALAGPRMLAGDFAPRGRAATHLKDLDAVLGQVADRPGALAASRVAREMLLRLGPRRNELDHSAMLLSARAALTTDDTAPRCPMTELAANLSTLFTEWPLPERPARAAACGFRHVELRGLEGHDPALVGKAMKAAGVGCALINADSGDLSRGELGLAADPATAGRFRESVARAVEAASELGAPLVHVMAGRIDPAVPRDAQLARAGDAYRDAAAAAGSAGVAVVIEPLSPTLAPDYLFTDLDLAARFVEGIGQPGLGLLFDLFHMQLAGGNILGRFERVRPHVRHVQMAAVPDRGEPGRGELDIAYVLEGLAARGYTGLVGCEYVPRDGTLAGLSWAAPWGIRT
jgi:3-hydroxyisobutyrate dehydrogenase-like beta-hydroxyacid dehydrogenase/hydroxypyruvate isomerase